MTPPRAAVLPALTGRVAIEFDFDVAGALSHACVLDATSRVLAREAIELVRSYEPRAPLTSEEALCFGNSRFVAELTPGAQR